MNIFKTFEIFLREPLSILKQGVIQLVNVNSDFASKASVSVDMLDKKTQITIVNSDKMYNLFKTVLYKRENIAAQKLALPATRGKMVIGQLCKRQ